MEFYHALNRGVDKRAIAMNDTDRLRFVQDLYDMNNTASVENTVRIPLFDLRGRTENAFRNRDRLVDVHAWCLMGNHYHLLISERVGGGISKFLMKLNVGYTKYFNLRYARSGVLFQGKTKRVLIGNDRQFLYILPYIHMNPLDFMEGGKAWRAQSLAKPRAALKWITEYRWSSYRNYAGEKEFAEILEGSELFADRKSHTKELQRFLRAMPDQTLTTLNLE